MIAPHLKGDFVVDSTEHDTTSILATIEHRYGLDPLGSRDAAVSDMSSVFDAKKPKGAQLGSAGICLHEKASRGRSREIPATAPVRSRGS